MIMIMLHGSSRFWLTLVLTAVITLGVLVGMKEKGEKQ